MSGHNEGPGPQPHHTGHPAIRAAAAAIILLALGACSSTTTTPATSTAASAGPSGGPGILTGAGSTYVAPFFALAFARYHQQHPAVTVNYSAVGSSAGIAAISARQVNFGASDVPMNASELAALVTMLAWLTHDGQAYAAANSYVPLPPQVRQLALTMLQQVTGPGGTHLLS